MHTLLCKDIDVFCICVFSLFTLLITDLDLYAFLEAKKQVLEVSAVLNTCFLDFHPPLTTSLFTALAKFLVRLYYRHFLIARFLPDLLQC